MNISYQCSAVAGALFLGAILNCAEGEPTQSYTVPKEHPAMQPAPAQPPVGTPEITINSAPVRWTLPAGWKEKPAGGVRLASFDVGGQNGAKADVYITSFPGTAGTELDNVNRWRGELALTPVAQGDVASEPVTVDSLPGKIYDIAGASARTVVAVVPRNGNSWFIKMRGDASTVAAAKPAFLEFLKSVHFGADAGQTAVGAAMPAGMDPHAGMQPPRSPHGAHGVPTTAPTDAPQWNVPGQWAEAPPRTMIFKSFSVSGEGDAKADITVSYFPGAVGGVLANVNRWRGQMGLPPVEQGKLDTITESLKTQDGSATLVDITGAASETGKPARMVAAIIPHGGNTWFFKLTGDGRVVEGQKDAFVQFVKSVHYP